MVGPIAVYNNWSAYDELSDNVELTEELALRQLREVVRLRGAGVRLDYYLMDAFWYGPCGGYREFRKPHWPNGPEGWLGACRAALRRFREKNPELLFTAFNGFGGRIDGTFHPIEPTVDRLWREAFDALYCGDPRPADVPAFHF